MNINRNVLVTGGAGYVGSFTCKALQKHGYRPIVFDNLSTGHRDSCRWGLFIEGDLQDLDLLRSVIKRYEISRIIHFAASAYVGESIDNPLKYYDNNIVGTVSLLRACENLPTVNLVFSSSCAVYGTPNEIPIVETANKTPVNPYGLTKLISEELINDYSKFSNLSFVNLRYFNAAGASEDLELGELHEPETHIIPLAINAALKNSVLSIFGGDFPTQDGTAIRDYVHVNDLGLAHVKALEYLENRGKSISLNLGSGNGTSVLQIVTLLKEFGLDVRYEILPRRIGDPAILIADIEAAKKALNWKPAHSDIQNVISSAIKWAKANPSSSAG